MTITPVELHHVDLPRSWRGYRRKPVDQLIEDVARSFEEVWRERAAASPARRYGDPAEFGSYFAYLCSAQAGYIAAQNLLIDGGSYPGTF